jgi:cell division protein FtsQ
MKKRAAQRRARFFLFLVAAVVLAVMFLTPVFNIRTVSIEGADKVTAEQTDGIVRAVQGQNLFTVSTKKLKENFGAIPYVKDVSVKRRLYKPSLTVTLTERVPVAYVSSASGFVLIDSECIILETSLQPPSDIPQITGVSVTSPVPGSKIDVDETNKSDIIVMCIENLGSISSKIKTIDVSDVENISFDYENRLNVICGSSLDFEDKIKLFNEAINSNRIASNARGTMDLSNTGEAVYKP